MDLDAGVPGNKVGEQFRQDVLCQRGACPDMKRTGKGVAAFVEFEQDFPLFLQQGGDGFQKVFSRFGELHPAFFPMEEGDGQFPFQFLDAFGYGGLR